MLYVLYNVCLWVEREKYSYVRLNLIRSVTKTSRGVNIPLYDDEVVRGDFIKKKKKKCVCTYFGFVPPPRQKMYFFLLVF